MQIDTQGDHRDSFTDQQHVGAVVIDDQHLTAAGTFRPGA